MKSNFFNIFCCAIFVLLNGCSGLVHDKSPSIHNKEQTEKYFRKQNQPTKPESLGLDLEKKEPSAVGVLIAEADGYSKQGNFESAVAKIERALRISPRNPFLIYKLAKLRLKQHKPSLSEDLAKKAAVLSANDKWLKRQCWLLISIARKQQNNTYGAQEAKQKADQL
jgi:Tfp pilus assembly protein PilF